MSFSVKLARPGRRRPSLPEALTESDGSRPLAARRSVARVAAARVAAALLPAAVLLTSGAARAECIAPAPSIVWSSPAADAVDVPTDADLLLITEAIDLSKAELTLVGGAIEQAIELGSALPGHFELDELEPNRAYTIVIAPIDSEPIELPFVTGERRAGGERQAAGTPRLRSVIHTKAFEVLNRPSKPDVPSFCAKVLWRDSCYDTGVPDRLTFDIDRSTAPGGDQSLWAMELINSNGSSWVGPWPVSCGAPETLGNPTDATFRLYHIGESGVVRASNVVVGSEEAEPDSDVRQPHLCTFEGGAAPSPSSLFAAAAVAAVAAVRRRRART